MQNFIRKMRRAIILAAAGNWAVVLNIKHGGIDASGAPGALVRNAVSFD